MSVTYYSNDLLKVLQLNSKEGDFLPIPYPSGSSVRIVKHTNSTSTQFINLVSFQKHPCCPHCGCTNEFKSKGVRTIYLRHTSLGFTKTVLEVTYRRYTCLACNKTFKDSIPFRFYDTKITTTLAQQIILSLRENTAMAVVARMYGVSKSTVYRIFYNNIYFYHRMQHLPSTMSIDEFRATTDEGIFAFNIVNPITGKTIDIIGDRKANSLKKYFLSFGHNERKKVKIIIMDLSNAFHSIMKSLFPNAMIIADKFHYVRNVGDNLTQARIQCCKKMSDESLSSLIKRNLHLFDKYKKKLRDKKERYIPYFKKHYTSKQLVEAILELDSCSDLKENYDIYQDFLKIIYEPSNDYKKLLNKWLDNIFDTKNIFYIKTAKNFRKNWFMPILRSLTFKAKYIRNGKYYYTSFNNGFIESMNNKVKLVKRNAYGYRYFQNLRKRILLHLGFGYQFVEKKRQTTN